MRISIRLCHKVLFILAAFVILKTGYTQSVPRADNEESILNIHKCLCDASEVIVDDRCLERETTFNFLISNLHRTTKKLRSSKVGNVTISNISCPSGYFQVTLPGDEFAFVENGNLLHTGSDITVRFSDYCIEYYSDEQNEIYSDVKLCLKVPKVQTCCQSHVSSCDSTIQSRLSLPAWVGGFLQGIPALGTEANVLCESDTNMTHSLLFQDTTFGAKLEYTNEGLILSYSTPQKSEVEFFDSVDYCITNYPMGSSPSEVTFCYKDPQAFYNQTCKDFVCIAKCCSEGMLFSFDDLGCAPGMEAEIWKPTFYDALNHLEKEMSHLNTSSYHVLHGYPICGNGSYFLDPEDISKTVIKLLDDGHLLEERGQTFWEPLNYCIDNFKRDNRIVEKALVCFKVAESLEKRCDEATGIIYPILLIISAICLVLTLAVYLFVPELSAKIQGKSLISSIVALIAAYICLITVQLASNQLSITGCSIIALFMQFSLLASFFWLNIMSYDIWRTFRCLKIRKESPTSSRRRFILYSIYAWGCPLIIVIVTAIMQFLPDQDGEDELVRPKFSETSCFFTHYDQRASWAYFHGFITIILVVNTFFFVHLAWILVKAQKVSENALGRRNQHYTEWAKLYLKLFIVMGVTWVFEVVAYVEGSCSLWIVTDIINTLRGVFIFVIFICKHDTLKKIRTRGSPAISSIRTTFNTSSSFFSRSSKRASSQYNNEPTATRPTEDTNFLPEQRL